MPRHKTRPTRHNSLHLPPSPTLLELRAAQRTFEGAYVRTALSQFSFSLVILKIFSREFYPIGALFAAFGAAILGIAWWRRRDGNRQLWEGVRAKSRRREGGEGSEGRSGGNGGQGEEERVMKKFKTSGGVVAAMGIITVGVYAGLLVLVWRL